MAQALSFVFVLLCSTSASEWYPQESSWSKGKDYEKEGDARENFDVAYGKSSEQYNKGDREHYADNHKHADYHHNVKGFADGFAEFKKLLSEGHVGGSLNAGHSAIDDAEGRKKYSYFTEGYGPDGFYSKGYWGMNGFNHEAAKFGQIKEGKEEDFKKIGDSTNDKAEHGHSTWTDGKVREANRDHHHHHDVWAKAENEHNKGKHEDGWKKEYADTWHDKHLDHIDHK